MTDHIVVFDGNDRLIGQTVTVHVEEASAFTLFGVAETGEVGGNDLTPRMAGAKVADQRTSLPVL